VHDGVHAGERTGHCLLVPDVALDELDIVGGDVLAAPPGEVVEATDRGPTLEEHGDEVRADEAAGAGDEDSLGNVPSG
jgi:hypothetical protein